MIENIKGFLILIGITLSTIFGVQLVKSKEKSKNLEANAKRKDEESKARAEWNDSDDDAKSKWLLDNLEKRNKRS